MTAEQRKNILEVLHSLRFDSLPDDALDFLGGYLLSPSADAKVSCLLDEAKRLHEVGSCYGEPHYEHVTLPSGLGNQGDTLAPVDGEGRADG